MRVVPAVAAREGVAARERVTARDGTAGRDRVQPDRAAGRRPFDAETDIPAAA